MYIAYIINYADDAEMGSCRDIRYLISDISDIPRSRSRSSPLTAWYMYMVYMIYVYGIWYMYMVYIYYIYIYENADSFPSMHISTRGYANGPDFRSAICNI